MAFTRAKYETNVFEAGIGDDDDIVQADRSGMLLVSTDQQTVDAIAKKREQLASYSVTGWSFQTEGKGPKTVVFALFDIVDKDDQKIRFKTCVFREGKFFEVDQTVASLCAANDKDVQVLADRLAAIITSRLSKPGTVLTPGILSGPKAVYDRLCEVLALDYQSASERVRAQIRAIKLMQPFADAARQAYYDSIRDQFHRVIRNYHGVTIEELHRMLDEIECIGVHDT